MSNADQDQRRFDPTPRRVEDFRRRGQLALSRDLTTALALTGGAAAGLSLSAGTGHGLLSYFTEAFSLGTSLTQSEALWRAAQAWSGALAPTVAGALAGLVIAGAIQLGPSPATAPVKFDLSRLLSPDTLTQIFSPKAQAERALKALLKIGFVGMAAYLAIDDEWATFMRSPALEAGAVLSRAGDAAQHAFTWAGGALLLLATGDYVLARRRLWNQMKMTFEELKREMREQEGDPAVKRKRRQRMRELSKRRFGAAVKSSDVVLVNPTEFAVALRYRSKKDRAPRVVAKGKGKQAERIRELAREAGVPIVPNIPLARFLFRAVPEGKEIPPNVYQAVAEILGYVYRIQRRVAR